MFKYYKDPFFFALNAIAWPIATLLAERSPENESYKTLSVLHCPSATQKSLLRFGFKLWMFLALIISIDELIIRNFCKETTV